MIYTIKQYWSLFLAFHVQTNMCSLGISTAMRGESPSTLIKLNPTRWFFSSYKVSISFPTKWSTRSLHARCPRHSPLSPCHPFVILCFITYSSIINQIFYWFSSITLSISLHVRCPHHSPLSSCHPLLITKNMSTSSLHVQCFVSSPISL
jgi:hypothetical protein